MPYHSRPRLSRRRRHPLPLQSDDYDWSIYHPDPDEPILIEEFGDAAMLAAEVWQLPAHKEVLVLLDERRRVTAILLDPPAEVGRAVLRVVVFRREVVEERGVLPVGHPRVRIVDGDRVMSAWRGPGCGHRGRRKVGHRLTLFGGRTAQPGRDSIPRGPLRCAIALPGWAVDTSRCRRHLEPSVMSTP